MPVDDPAPVQPLRRVRYHLGRCEDALDDATTALHEVPSQDGGSWEQAAGDLAVLRYKLDLLRTLMNGQ